MIKVIALLMTFFIMFLACVSVVGMLLSLFGLAPLILGMILSVGIVLIAASVLAG